VLIIAGRNDPRCPPRQIGTYTDALAAAGAAFDVHWHDTGHSSAVTQERVDAFRHALSFVLGHLGPEPGRSACTTAG
jgi:predicted esterase